jgi:hypothetical protein
VYLYFDNSTGIKYTPITETIEGRGFSFSRRYITTSGWSLHWGRLEKFQNGVQSECTEKLEGTFNTEIGNKNLSRIFDEIYFACNEETDEFKLRTVEQKSAKVVDEMDLFLLFIVRMQDGTTYKIVLGFLERGDSTDKFNNIRDWMDRWDPLGRRWRFDVTSNSDITHGFGRIPGDKKEYRFEIWYIDAQPVNLYRFRFEYQADLDFLKGRRHENRDSNNDDIHPQTLVSIFDNYFK